MSKRRGRGEGTIALRADGRWMAQVQLGWRDGKRHRKSIYGKTRQEVATKLVVAQRELQQGLLRVDERTRTDAYLERWCNEVLPGTVKISTAAGYSYVLKRYVNPHLGPIPLARLTPADVQKMLRSLEAQGLSNATRRQARAILRRALGQAERWGLVPRNAAGLVDAPSCSGRARHDAMDESEAAAVLAACDGDRIEAAVKLALAVGLRRGEVLALRWSDVDLDARCVTIAGTLKRVSGVGLVIDAPKTARSARTVPLPDFCIAALRTQHRRQSGDRLAAGDSWIQTNHVLTTPIGTPVDPRNLTRDFHRLTTRAGLGNRRFHSLRHSAATLMLSSGVPLEVISTTLGHASYSITADVYAEVKPVLQRRAADAMQELLGWSGA